MIYVGIIFEIQEVGLHPYDVVFGEIGLTGEVRCVSRIDQRVKEAKKLGFRKVIMPEKSLRDGLIRPVWRLSE